LRMNLYNFCGKYRDIGEEIGAKLYAKGQVIANRYRRKPR